MADEIPKLPDGEFYGSRELERLTGEKPRPIDPEIEAAIDRIVSEKFNQFVSAFHVAARDRLAGDT